MLLIWFIFSIFLSKTEAGTFSIDYPGKQFLKDGQPFRYISGEIHYFRIHPDYWNDRLMRVRAAGLNTIQAYIPWNFHEPQPGVYDFAGGKNFTNFFLMAQQLGLNVLVRPSPFIRSEFENGGLPWWLLNLEGIKFRQYEPNYINATTRWYNVLMPILKPLLYQNNGPILMVAVENGYGYNDSICDHKYTTYLRDTMRNLLGNDTVFFTDDEANLVELQCGFVNGTFADIEFPPIYNSTVATDYAMQQTFNGGGPKVTAEFFPGNVITWGDPAPNFPPTQNFLNTFMDIYAAGASFNVLMFHGGTNFGFNNGALPDKSVVTSYDSNAPISENGDLKDSYLSIRSFLSSQPDWNFTNTPLPSNNPASNYGPVPMQRVGNSLIATLTQIQEPCQQSPDPKTFEQLNHGFGFVLYSTVLSNGGTNLKVPYLKDYGYVFVNTIYYGMLSRDSPSTLSMDLPIRATAGDVLQIVVENRGRQSVGFSAYERSEMSKGLHSNVTLDGVRLQTWTSCGINLTKESIDSITSMSFGQEFYVPEKEAFAPGVYVGQFSANTLTDTFFNSTGWGKGQLFINGYNLGRYWNQGPQTTLYVPKPFIQQNNSVLLIELIGGNQNYANFIDHSVFSYSG